FGDWGTGKSFFMRLLKERIDDRAAIPPDDESDTAVTHVVQLRFNAWHYVDANIWASLATRIFQGIAEYLERSGGLAHDAHRILLGQLDSSQELLDEADQRKRAAEQALREAERRIAAVRQTRVHRDVSQLCENHPEAVAAVEELTGELGISPTTTI